jgi:2-polyprenyl-6-methoxyphenol hydroxylase-like FAD-dependent oxidoreductase
MELSENKTQVIIIGAGPTGLSMAAQCVRYGINFIILDKNKETTLLSKALVVHSRTLEIFKELGVAEKAIKSGQIAGRLNLMRHGELKTAIDISRLGEGLSEFPFVLSLEQSKTEKILYDFLLQNKKTVRWQSELTKLEQNESNVVIHYKDSNGRQQEISADYLAGSDGAHSLVRETLDLPFEGATEARLFYVADVIINSSVINKKEFYFFLTKKAFVLFFSMEGDGHYRIVGVLPDSADINTPFEFNDISGSIKEEVGCSLDFKELKWFSTYKIHSRKASQFYKNRCFICGDAAHIHTPAGGQGMNTGIQDAYNLAWKMAFVLKQQVNKSVLKTYSTERTQNADHLLKTTDRLFDMMAGTNLFWDFLRQYIFPFVVKEVSHTSVASKKIFPLISQTGIAYPGSDLSVESSIANIKAGDRMPYFITADGKSIYDLLIQPAFKILYFGEEDLNKNVIVNKITCNLIHLKEIPEDIFKKEINFYILLRPDNHISYIGKDLSKCVDFLHRISPSG